MNSKPTTIRDWLLQLPLDEATAALSNIGTYSPHADIISKMRCMSMCKALLGFMYWGMTAEGPEYWAYVYHRELKKENNDPANI